MAKQKFEITGMTCSACSSHVEKSVCKLSGMNEVTVNLLTNSMQVAYDESLCSEDKSLKRWRRPVTAQGRQRQKERRAETEPGQEKQRQATGQRERAKERQERTAPDGRP